MNYKVVLVWTVLCLTVACWAEDTNYEQGKEDYHKYEKKHVSYSKEYQYQGKYGGSCERDGFYYMDENSFVICSNSNAYVQPCAPGSQNSGLHGYQEGRSYNYHELCDVNLVDLGYGVLFGADKVDVGYPSKGPVKKDYGKAVTQYKKNEYSSSYSKVEKEPKEGYGYAQEGYASKQQYNSESKGSKAEAYGKTDSKLYTKKHKEYSKSYSNEYSQGKEENAYRNPAGYDGENQYAKPAPADVNYGEKKVEYLSQGHVEPYTASESGYREEVPYSSHRDLPGRYHAPAYNPHGDSTGPSYEDSDTLYAGPSKDRVPYGSETYSHTEKPRSHEVYGENPGSGYPDGSYEKPRYDEHYDTEGSSYKKHDYGRSYHQREIYSADEPHDRKPQLGYEAEENYNRANQEYEDVNTYKSDNVDNHLKPYEAKNTAGYVNNGAPGYGKFKHHAGPNDGYYQEKPYEEVNGKDVFYGRDQGHSERYDNQAESYGYEGDFHSNGRKNSYH